MNKRTYEQTEIVIPAWFIILVLLMIIIATVTIVAVIQSLGC